MTPILDMLARILVILAFITAALVIVALASTLTT